MKIFNKISLQTPESVELNFDLAGIGNRTYALIIDYIIWSLILLLVLIFGIFLYFQFVDMDEFSLWIISYLCWIFCDF